MTDNHSLFAQGLRRQAREKRKIMTILDEDTRGMSRLLKKLD